MTFEAETHLPMSTKYDLKVPASTTSVSGKSLGKDFRFSFTTQLVTLKRHAPDGVTDLNPSIFMLFDQRVDPSAILACTRLTSSKDTKLPVDALTVDVDKMKEVDDKKKHPSGRFVCLSLKAGIESLTLDTTYKVTVGSPGVPSAEGPIQGNLFSFNFSTPAPFHAKDCFHGNGTITISFNNQIKASAFRKAIDAAKKPFCTIEPRIPHKGEDADAKNAPKECKVLSVTPHNIVVKCAEPRGSYSLQLQPVAGAIDIYGQQFQVTCSIPFF